MNFFNSNPNPNPNHLMRNFGRAYEGTEDDQLAKLLPLDWYICGDLVTNSSISSLHDLYSVIPTNT